MKKILFWGALILAIVVTACKEDNKSGVDAKDLQDASNLKMKVTKASSIFESFQVSFNKNIGAEIKNIDGDIVRINVDSVTFFHKTALGVKTRVKGNWEMTTSDSIMIYTPDEILKLGEPYYLTAYFSWEQKDGGTWKAVKDNEREYYRSLWAEIKPIVIDGKDVVFSTKRGGENNTSLVPYDDEMFVNFNVPVLFDINENPGSEKIALLFNWINVTGNNKDDYAIWNLKTDSTKASFNYVSEIPETDMLHTHLLPNIYYSINLDMRYVYNNSGKWDFVINSAGDTSIWNYIKEFSTQELFNPGEILSSMLPKNKGVVMIDTIPQLMLNYTNGTVVNHNGIDFRPKLDYFKILKGSTEVPSSFMWLEKGDIEAATGDSMLARINPDSLYLLPGSNYVVTASAHWEYQTDTAWNNILQLDTITRDVRTSKVASALPKIPSIVSSYSIEAEKVNMNANVAIMLSNSRGQTINVKGFNFKPVLDALTLKSGGSFQVDTFKWDESGKSALVLLDSLLLPSLDYEIITQAHWEYEDKDGIFKQFSEDGLITFENKNFQFKTMSVPGPIVQSILPKGSGRNLNSIPGITFNYSDGSEIDHNGIRFKVNYDKDSLKFYAGSDHLDSSMYVAYDQVVWEDQSATIQHSKILKPDTKYQIRMLTHWQYWENDEWKNILDKGKIRFEGETAKGFRTTLPPQNIFGELSPASSGIAIDSMISLGLNYDKDIPFEFGGTNFRVVVDEYILLNGTDTVDVSSDWTNAKKGVLTPIDYLKLNTSYKVVAKLHAEYKDEESNWIVADLPAADLKKEVTFTTAMDPGTIIKSIAPSGSNIKTDSMITLTLNFSKDAMVAHAGTEFKTVLDSIVVSNGTGSVAGSLAFDAENKIGTFSVTPLTAGETYESNAYAHWEYKNKSGAMVVLEQQMKSQSFTVIAN